MDVSRPNLVGGWGAPAGTRTPEAVDPHDDTPVATVPLAGADEAKAAGRRRRRRRAPLGQGSGVRASCTAATSGSLADWLSTVERPPGRLRIEVDPPRACRRRSSRGQNGESWAEGARHARLLPELARSTNDDGLALDDVVDQPVMTEETFGPVVPVRVVRSFDEGLRLADSGTSAWPPPCSRRPSSTPIGRGPSSGPGP